jgi:hypothetical protein
MLRLLIRNLSNLVNCLIPNLFTMIIMTVDNQSCITGFQTNTDLREELYKTMASLLWKLAIQRGKYKHIYPPITLLN